MRQRRLKVFCSLVVGITIAWLWFAVRTVHRLERTSLHEFRRQPTRSRSSTTQRRSHAYQSGPVCPGCVLSFRLPTKTCGSLIHDATSKNISSVTEAALAVARDDPDNCGICNPSACTSKLFWRMDRVAPKILQSRTFYLNSIGEDARMPVSALDDLHRFFSDPKNVYPRRQYLFEFNPSLIRLPESQRIEVLGERPIYMASFRVGNDHLCVANHTLRSMMVGGLWHEWKGGNNYLGLALLRNDFSVIADMVVDAKQYMHRFTDPRLHVLHDQVYVTSYQRVHPIWLNPPPDLPEIFTDGKESFPFAVSLPGLWDNPFNVTMRRYGSCSSDRNIQKAGKNLQYFIDADDRTVMEVDPMGRKDHVNLTTRCKMAPKGQNLAFIESNRSLPPVAFGSTDELHFLRLGSPEFPYSGDHGSSCCVEIVSTDGRELFLGVSHQRSRPGEASRFGVGALMYTSTFYAMERQAPYHVVARSGRFCLGFPSGEEIAASTNPYAYMHTTRLTVGDEYECPRIHFIGGMLVKADEPDKLVLTYGVNDCYSRVAVLSMADVISMLFETDHYLATIV